MPDPSHSPRLATAIYTSSGVLYVMTPETVAQIHEGNQWVNTVSAGNLEAAHNIVQEFGGAVLREPSSGTYGVDTVCKYARKITYGIKANQARQHWRTRVAAQVGTDVASVWAISPEQLHHFLVEGSHAKMSWQEWVSNWDDIEGDLRKHGGAVFHTGGDGSFEVTVDGAVSEAGYTAPYGTSKASAARVILGHAADRMARHAFLLRVAGWWGIDESGKGGPGKKDTGLHLGDGPLDMRLEFIDQIDLVYRQAWDRPVTHMELQAVFDVSHLVDSDRSWPRNGWIDEAVKETGYSHSIITALDRQSLDSARRLWRDYRNSRFMAAGGPTGSDLYEGFMDHMKAAVSLGRSDARKLLGEPPENR